MKVYRVISSSGEWEYCCERCVGCYILENDAMKKKLKLEKRESELITQSKLCKKCDYRCGLNKDCDKYFEDEDGDCKEYYTIYEETTYRIESEEVIGLQELIDSIKRYPMLRRFEKNE